MASLNSRMLKTINFIEIVVLYHQKPKWTPAKLQTHQPHVFNLQKKGCWISAASAKKRERTRKWLHHIIFQTACKLWKAVIKTAKMNNKLASTFTNMKKQKNLQSLINSNISKILNHKISFLKHPIIITTPV